MQYRRVGHTELSVSEIGFGCGGNAGLIVRGESREQIRVIERALALGVTYFDNAPDYGDGKAEENLGRALKQLGARPVINSRSRSGRQTSATSPATWCVRPKRVSGASVSSSWIFSRCTTALPALSL